MNLSEISGLFGLGICLASARGKLSYGLEPFEKALEKLCDGRRQSHAKNAFKNSPQFAEIMAEITEQKKTQQHPKLLKLKELIEEHLAKYQDTRIIVFSNMRDSVSEIVDFLTQEIPAAKVSPLIGKAGSKGQMQKVQNAVLDRFRLGNRNVLVSTSIGEEGLDVGEVDLIVNFDSTTSPVRSVQRGGRTGRKRAGRVVMLVSDGQEKKKHETGVRKLESFKKQLKSLAAFNLFTENPRMMPEDISPVCRREKFDIAERPKQTTLKFGGKKVKRRSWELTDDQLDFLSVYKVSGETLMNLNFDPFRADSFHLQSALTPFCHVRHSSITHAQARLLMLFQEPTEEIEERYRRRVSKYGSEISRFLKSQSTQPDIVSAFEKGKKKKKKRKNRKPKSSEDENSIAGCGDPRLAEFEFSGEFPWKRISRQLPAIPWPDPWCLANEENVEMESSIQLDSADISLSPAFTPPDVFADDLLPPDELSGRQLVDEIPPLAQKDGCSPADDMVAMSLTALQKRFRERREAMAGIFSRFDKSAEVANIQNEVGDGA
eukprot:258888_1